jgi:hypothetical protein
MNKLFLIVTLLFIGCIENTRNKPVNSSIGNTISGKVISVVDGDTFWF